MSQLKSYISKGIQPIFETFVSSRRCWGRAFGWIASGAQNFTLQWKVKTLRIDNIWNLPLSTGRECQLKSYISKAIQPMFEIFPSTRSCWGWAFGWKVSDAQVFYFCNGKVKTLRIDNISIFPLSTCKMCWEKIVYLQRYSTDFRKLCFSSKILRVGMLVESFRWAVILLLQWQGENVPHRQHLKFATFNL